MTKDGSRFDFIVVGGGTAGNVVAGRLAENPNTSILVVEAGVGNPEDHDWGYKTTMVKRDDYERIEKPNTRGKALGGSSSLNYFTWVPGCKPTFDRWGEYGGKEWTWDPRIDSYFEKDKLYKERKAANGGKDPFSPEGQPHFELDFVAMFGSAFQWHYPTPKKGCYMSVVVDLVCPVSDPGEVTLHSADPLCQPNINLNFFADDLDIVGMREGIRFSYDVLTKGEGFKDIVLGDYPWEMPLDSDEEMHRAVLDRCQTAFHPCGTARLSKDIDQGVVDAKLKVHGVKKLRVIDASIMPVIPDCRAQNSVYMIGEKGAVLIKAEHKDLYLFVPGGTAEPDWANQTVNQTLTRDILAIKIKFTGQSFGSELC